MDAATKYICPDGDLTAVNGSLPMPDVSQVESQPPPSPRNSVKNKPRCKVPKMKAPPFSSATIGPTPTLTQDAGEYALLRFVCSTHNRREREGANAAQ